MVLVDFYQQKAKTAAGNSLSQILSWSNQDLEKSHTWVSWLFPSTRPSDFNRDAPVLSREDIEAFRTSPLLHSQLLLSFRRALAFYGLALREREGQKIVEPAADWPERKQEWLLWGDHNHRRITRILDALTTLGLEEHAQSFLRFLEELSQTKEGRREISEQSRILWRRAVGITPPGMPRSASSPKDPAP